MKKSINKSKTKKNISGQSKDKSGEAEMYPASLLAPVGRFLQQKLYTLEKRKEEVDEDDPFRDTNRLLDNASPDADAAEQFGHARVSAIREQLDRKIIQTRKALARIRIGKYGVCEDCGEMIDTDRLVAYPEATICAKDQSKREK
jgi:DnaK suppressor protein